MVEHEHRLSVHPKPPNFKLPTTDINFGLTFAFYSL